MLGDEGESSLELIFIRHLLVSCNYPKKHGAGVDGDKIQDKEKVREVSLWN